LNGAGREALLAAFLDRCGWGAARRRPLAVDASTRHYLRLAGKAGTAVLMDAPPDAETRSCPADATPEQRTELGYNAVARLAGADVHAFASFASELVARGFSAPKVLAADAANGFLLLEDLGDDLFARMADSGAVPVRDLYESATDCLAALSRCSFDARLPTGHADWLVQDYDHTALLAETQLMGAWYAPYRGTAPEAEALAEADVLWEKAFAVLDDLPSVLVLRDFHAQNLLWLDKRSGIARTGLLDFQDALFGSPAYDLVSMVQDSRRILPDGLEQAMIARFIDKARLTDEQAFTVSYAVLGAQRAAKVLGIFVRLARRDNKPLYLKYLPIAAHNLVRSLQHNHLHDLRAWMQRHLPAVFDEQIP